ncbi:MAG: dicarboxylate/amino acid:cation symporter [Chloroflexi bacterium CG07_land_8_20_14_0_80_45_17]|nr:MAG: dicarboxylate/amino acid:cation symporter [Chloroflexi bacterium CG23_combo_of_CG06-09_8_20_14_all_45_10]PIU56277.1 MAG: dicarboxylate/amino acid:cation symporter [Chloroflexi bacterium CG07_land_8_20_14_0_80_45_17]
MAERRRGGYFGFPLIYKILIGLVIGIIVGIAVGPAITAVKPLGDFFIRLLQMIVMPVVFFSLVVGAASISPVRGVRAGGKTIGFYIVTTVIAIAIGLALANLFKPGLGMALVGEGVAKEVTAPAMKDVFLGLIPTNPFAALATGAVLPTIVFAILLGTALSYIKGLKVPRITEASENVLRVFDGLAEAMYKMVRWILEVAPYGVFALIAVVVGTQGTKVFGPLAVVTGAVYLGLIIHYLVVYGGALRIWGLNPVRLWSGARDASITAFVTRSSSGTLPVTMRVAEENLGIDRGLYSFTLPLGATVNMDGTALYQAVCALFVANAIGMPLTIGAQMIVMLTAVLASIGTAGVPGAGAIMLLMVLQSVGLPVEAGSAVAIAYGMILGIDAILDMGRTSLNVTGDLVCTSIVAKTENMLNLDFWRGKAKAKA